MRLALRWKEDKKWTLLFRGKISADDARALFLFNIAEIDPGLDLVVALPRIHEFPGEESTTAALDAVKLLQGLKWLCQFIQFAMDMASRQSRKRSRPQFAFDVKQLSVNFCLAEKTSIASKRVMQLSSALQCAVNEKK